MGSTFKMPHRRRPSSSQLRSVVPTSRSFKATDVVAVLENIIAETGIVPAYVRCDSDPELTAGALIDWCSTAGVKRAFIDPRSSWQNGFIESFNAQFRREQLVGEIMGTWPKPVGSASIGGTGYGYRYRVDTETQTSGPYAQFHGWLRLSCDMVIRAPPSIPACSMPSKG